MAFVAFSVALVAVVVGLLIGFHLMLEWSRKTINDYVDSTQATIKVVADTVLGNSAPEPIMPQSPELESELQKTQGWWNTNLELPDPTDITNPSIERPLIAYGGNGNGPQAPDMSAEYEK